jgi:tetratricopeptide (TPR) repeat protein
MGAAMFTAKDFPGAVKAFARAIEINPALPRLYSYYGQALLVTGDPEGASDAFRKQLSTDPNDYESNLQLAEILIHRRAFSEAEPLLRRAVLVRGQSAEARYALASNFQAEGKTDEARREFETIVKQWPEFGAAHARLAEVYERAGLPAEAAREKALAAKFGIPKTQPEPVGLQPGTPAPAFELARSGGKGRVSVPSPQPGRPTVLVFGSYSCPNFRGAAPVLNRLAAEYGNRSAFLLVYIREAHATGQWQSSINQRENVTLAPAATAEQKQEYATMCSRKLHLSFPAVVDGMDGATEKAYAAWPSRAYVIGADGRVRYATALDEQDFDPKALEAAIRQSIAGSK